MTANPEQMLFTSTAQAFLEKEAPLSRVRQLHDEDTSFDAQWWGRAASWGGPACWYRRTWAAGACPATVSPIWH